MKKIKHKHLLFIIILALLSFVSAAFFKWQEPKYNARKALNELQNDYDVLSKILGSGFVHLGNKVLDENGTEYFEVEEAEYGTTKELKSIIDRVYTENYTQKILRIYFEGDSPIIKDIGGKLCKIDAYAGVTDISLPIQSVKKVSSDVLEVTMHSDSDEYYTFIRLKKEDDKWKIDDI